MTIIAICPGCQARIKAPVELVGKTVKCPGCTTPLTIRSASATPPPATKPPLPSVRSGAKPAPSALKPAPSRPRQVLDQLPEVEQEEEIVDVLPAEEEVVAVEEVEDIEEVDEVEDVVEVEEVEEGITPSRRGSRRRSDEDFDEDDRPRRSKKRKSDPDREDARDRRENERTLAMLLHLSSLLTGFIGPLVIWLVKKEESHFIDHHGRTNLNFQVTLFLWCMGISIICWPLGFMLLSPSLWWLAWTIFILMILALSGLGIYSTIMLIVAGIQAKDGGWYELPAQVTPFGTSRDAERPY